MLSIPGFTSDSIRTVAKKLCQFLQNTDQFDDTKSSIFILNIGSSPKQNE
jgi:hypothetical protein